jgi:hypothetical protein
MLNPHSYLAQQGELMIQKFLGVPLVRKRNVDTFEIVS